MRSSSAGPKPAVRPARYATGLLREKSSHSAAIREAKSWKRSYSGCSMPSSRKPTDQPLKRRIPEKDERDSIFKFFRHEFALGPFPPLQKIRWKEFPQPAVPRNRPCCMRARYTPASIRIYIVFPDSGRPRFRPNLFGSATNLHYLCRMDSTKGYIHVYTGNGKGKTTAAFGLAVRALCAGKSVYIGQFVKSMRYNETKIGQLFDQVKIEQLGRGCFYRQGSRSDRYPDGTRRSDPLRRPAGERRIRRSHPRRTDHRPCISDC